MAKKLFDIVVVHYGEIALKGRNRPLFENALASNMMKSLKGLEYGSVKKVSGRFLVVLNGKSDPERISGRLRNVFGIEHFSFGTECGQDISEISKEALELMKGRKFKSFKVDTRRSNKSFKYTSREVNETVGEFLKGRTKKKVDLTRPDLTVYIEIVERKAYLYTEKIPGPGGLPVGVSGRAVSMVSSGIDSPVASYKAMKRGLEIIYVHFHSYPITNKASISKAVRIVERLDRHQNGSVLYLVPFKDIQDRIVEKAPQSLRIILYRRFMIRIAEAIADLNKAKAIVTGESVGQVASQTIDNIYVIDAAAGMPILRPVIGEDKKDIIREAELIGTYNISIEPHDDCCSLFLPKSPETHSKIGIVEGAEKNLDMEALIKDAIEKTEIKRINSSGD